MSWKLAVDSFLLTVEFLYIVATSKLEVTNQHHPFTHASTMGNTQNYCSLQM